MERYYFSYGSNLCQEQMKERCSTAFSIGKAVLSNYQLCFDEYSARWGGGAATIEKKTNQQVVGALYKLTKEDEVKLDQFEKIPSVYKKKKITIKNYSKVNIFTYIKPLRYKLAPSISYLTKIAQGYVDFGLDFCYLKGALCRSSYVGNAVFVEKKFLTLLKSFKNPNFCFPSSYRKIMGEIFFYDNQNNYLLSVLNGLDKYFSCKFTRKIGIFSMQKTMIPAWYYEKNK